MKKIALITADNGNGGAARATRRIAKGLTKVSEDLFSIELICNGNKEYGYLQRKPIYKWYTKLIYKNAISSKIFKAIIYKLWKKLNLKQKKDSMLFFRIGNSINNKNTFGKYEILHIFWGQNFINPAAIAALNKNVILTLHDMWFLTGGCAFNFDSEDYKEKFLNIFGKRNFDNQYKLKKKLLFSSKTQIIVTSDWMKKKCIDYGIEEYKIKKIFNYIPSHYMFLDMKYESMQLINWTNEVFSKKIIYFVGNINDFRKGFDFLVSALDLLPSDIKSRIAIQILGSNQTKITKLDNLNIDYLSIGIFNDEISQIIAYNAADLLICPSSLDNSPNVIAEAQMCGLPIFVRSGTGASEMIEEGLSGKTFSSNRVEDLKTQISDFVLGKLKYNSFEISKKASITYGIENTCKKYIDLYNNFEPI
tara:strand:+ start:2086 stop:3345 length:1260 start_codon:yes stop_codon:yes gene_type:complete